MMDIRVQSPGPSSQTNMAGLSSHNEYPYNDDYS